MATNVQPRPRSPEVERARAEERKQRLEQQRYELDVKNHELEKAKIIVDVMKHIVTVITALLLVLTYFGDKLIPAMRASNMWALAVVGIYFSLGWSVTALLMIARNPMWPSQERRAGLLFASLFIALLLSMAAILVRLAVLP